jgi:hypothetical protein
MNGDIMVVVGLAGVLLWTYVILPLVFFGG